MKHLIKFQKNNGLVADGVIGRKTLLMMMDVFKIPSKEATAHFVGQLSHETAYFKYDKENLNYSASGLQRVFRKYFPTRELADAYARQPQKIGSRVYADRMGNGNEQSGDGYLYRGRGSIQLTGKNNYTLFSNYSGSDVVCNPDLVIKDHYFDVALWFFGHRGIWEHCDRITKDNIKRVTRLINGGYNGLDHRYNLTLHYYKLIR